MDITFTSVIQALKEHFSRHGIPDTVVSDNGSQFSSQEFHEFSLSWEFSQVTSSPHCPKSNGKTELSVKIVKQLFKKAERDRKDPWLALLYYNNTPTEGVGDGWCKPRPEAYVKEYPYLDANFYKSAAFYSKSRPC